MVREFAFQSRVGGSILSHFLLVAFGKPLINKSLLSLFTQQMSGKLAQEDFDGPRQEEL